MSTSNQDSSSGLRSIRLIEGKPFEETQAVEIIDQLLLPHQFKWITISNPIEAHRAIKAMNIRGAPAIGSLAALALACGLLRLSTTKGGDLSLEDIKEYLKLNSVLLISARPTAVNLQEAIERVNTQFEQLLSDVNHSSSIIIVNSLVEMCKLIWTEDVERNKKIGSLGAQWLIESLKLKPTEKLSILTVCNTGSLATSGYGTALGVITALHEMNRLEHTYFMQTTPYLQGARLTSLELQTLSIPSTMIGKLELDPIPFSLSSQASADLDELTHHQNNNDRIASNGDTANKISTYQISLICKYGNNPKLKPRIPVMIAAPRTTIDLSIQTGESISIEERSSLEACTVRGKVINGGSLQGNVADDGQVNVATVLVTPQNTVALNPAFDVTPANLIDAISTEVGVIVKDSGNDQFDLRTYFK
ncbi:hypothetical protein PSTT_01259 [Puccinia striiformis]|uniref:S-methyl-5-thioribose-1-phosphate isomerase n=1 Tax=Puccinia striiformis TaxID=27350 RepID=A0A2S4W3U3_9BASI|nr:hypothetical protein PSTT_01259 [Puccinia striiformis]